MPGWEMNCRHCHFPLRPMPTSNERPMRPCPRINWQHCHFSLRGALRVQRQFISQPRFSIALETVLGNELPLHPKNAPKTQMTMLPVDSRTRSHGSLMRGAAPPRTPPAANFIGIILRVLMALRRNFSRWGGGGEVYLLPRRLGT